MTNPTSRQECEELLPSLAPNQKLKRKDPEAFREKVNLAWQMAQERDLMPKPKSAKRIPVSLRFPAVPPPALTRSDREREGGAIGASVVLHRRRKSGPSLSCDASSQAASAAPATLRVGLSGVDVGLGPVCWLLLYSSRYTYWPGPIARRSRRSATAISLRRRPQLTKPK